MPYVGLCTLRVSTSLVLIPFVYYSCARFVVLFHLLVTQFILTFNFNCTCIMLACINCYYTLFVTHTHNRVCTSCSLSLSSPPSYSVLDLPFIAANRRTSHCYSLTSILRVHSTFTYLLDIDYTYTCLILAYCVLLYFLSL